MTFTRQRSFAIMLLTSMVMSYACGQAGKGGDDSSKNAVSSTEETINGSLVSQTGGQREMAGWIVVMTERDTAVSRVAEVDQAGSFSLKGVDTSKIQTISLLSSDYKLAAVLSMPGAKTGTVRQYFKIKTKTLPRLIHKGPIVEFFATSALEVAADSSQDADADRTPNGMDPTVNGLLTMATADTDADGIANEKDLDIDGDGIPNFLDTDADGDNTLNVFDTDANGDGIIDAAQKVGMQYFTEGVEFIAVQVTVEPQLSGTNRLSVTLTTKVRDGVSPAVVRLRGSQALFNAATVEKQDPATGNTFPEPFDGQLLDDGNSNDGSAGDKIYARRVFLAEDKSPKSNQAIFIQLAFGSGSNVWFKEYGYTFPTITLGSVSASYDANVHTLSIIGTPFGSVSDYFWSADIFDAAGTKAYSTSVVSGSTNFQQLPSDVLDAGTTYQATVYAQSIDPIPGYAAYIVKSLPSDM